MTATLWSGQTAGAIDELSSAPGRAARFGAVDVQYLDDGGARAALVIAEDAAFTTLAEERTVLVEHVAGYRPGRFYERELPALERVLSAAAPVDLLIVPPDSFPPG